MELSDWFLDLNQLTHLNLGQNYITDEGLKQLIPYLSNMKQLVSLNLDYNSINNEGAISLSGLLKQMNKLVYLSLSNNEIKQSGILKIYESIKDKAKNFEYFNINTNQVNIEPELVSLYQAFESIQYFNIRKSGINRSNHNYLKEIITQSLKKIHLSFIDLDEIISRGPICKIQNYYDNISHTIDYTIDNIINVTRNTEVQTNFSSFCNVYGEKKDYEGLSIKKSKLLLEILRNSKLKNS